MTLTVKFAATKKPELPTTSRKQARPAPDESPIPNAGALPARAPAPPRMTAEEKVREVYLSSGMLFQLKFERLLFEER